MADNAPATTSPEAKVYDNPVDEIADLLSIDSEEEAADTTAEDTTTEEDETENSDSLDEDQESDDEDNSDNDDDVEPEENDKSLAEMLGLDESQVSVDEESGEFLVNTNSKGELKSVNLKDVVAGYQTQQVNTQKSQALAEEKRVFDGQVQQKGAEIKAQVEQNAALTNMLHQELMQEYQSTDWNQLRQIDPAEYSARQHDFQVKQQRLQGINAEVQAANNKLVGEQQKATFDNANKLLTEQRELMVSNNPSWNNQDVMKKDINAIRSYLVDTHGFSDEDMSAVMDSRAIAIIQDAMAYKAGKSAVKPKLKAAPKIKKDKGRKAPKTSKLDRLTKAAKAATGTNKRRAEVDAISALLGG